MKSQSSNQSHNHESSNDVPTEPMIRIHDALKEAIESCEAAIKRAKLLRENGARHGRRQTFTSAWPGVR